MQECEIILTFLSLNCKLKVKTEPFCGMPTALKKKKTYDQLVNIITDFTTCL